ncbi:Bidirectional sugar transporter SWEET2-like protein [Drosera capensis]
MMMVFSSSVHIICRIAAGVAGNVFAIGLFVSPIQAFRRIIRSRSTLQFSGLPYIYALLNCLISCWYGSPIVSKDNIMVMTVNSIGAVFQLAYIALFIVYAERGKKLKMLGLLAMVVCLIGIVVFVSLRFFESVARRVFVGFLSCASLISMFSSPLFIINLVIRTKSVEYMPFYLSLSTFLMSSSFFVYGLFNGDPFVYAPNGIGAILGMTQLGVYTYYSNRRRDQEFTEPLIVSYS